MTAQANELSPSDQTEQWVREYFEQRDWHVDKLDVGKKRAADYRICRDSLCFLCEVKTVESVHANLPWAPSRDYHSALRKEKRAEIERWVAENPDSRLVLRPGQYEFAYGDKADFTRKYSNRPRFTQAQFEKFKEAMHLYFTNSSQVKDLPYRLRLDSDDLYVPYGEAREQFFKWLEGELLAIHTGKPGRRWHIDKLPGGNAVMYSTFYEIHRPSNENDARSRYLLSITGPYPGTSLELNIFSYGQLNLDAITKNIEAGIGQLEASASREDDQGIPRIIALAFASGLSFEWDELLPHISWLLKQHPNLNAIAIVDRVPDRAKPAEDEDLLGSISAAFTTPWVTSYVVVHNTWSEGKHPTIVGAFNDKWSRHLEAHMVAIPESWP